MTGQISILSSRLQALFHQLPYLPRAFTLVWRATRYWTLAWALMLLLQGVLPVALVYLTRWIVDGVVDAAAAGGSWQSVRPTLMLVALMATVMLANELLSSLTAWIRTAQSELVRDHITALIHEKSVAVDLAFYESPRYYDHLHRARTEAQYRPLTLLENAGTLLQNGITMVAMAAVLIPFGFWLPLALLVSTLPALLVVVLYSLRQYEWRMRRTPDERRSWYYDWSLTSDEIAAELRLFGFERYLQSSFQTLRRRLREESLRLARDEGLAEATARSFGLLVTGVALAWMVYRTMQNLITLGELALFYQAFHQGQRLMRSLLQNVGQVYSNILFLSHLFEFLDLEPRILDPGRPRKFPSPLKKGIGFRGVSFHYPEGERPALRDFNLFIPAGRTVAIVGANGSGKSTMVKLICRLYDPQQGQIELDGVDLRDFSLRELRKNITVLLQEPVRYNETVRENIRLGDVTADLDPARIERAAESAGARDIIDRLPRRYDSLLGKWFMDGSELSLGEWKRICLARTFFRQASIILLDEPTSGMDSWSEAEWMDRFMETARDQTAVIITHRFTTAMKVDMIHVMDRGQIVESGEHDQLLVREGLYARSWRRQRRETEDAT